MPYNQPAKMRSSVYLSCIVSIILFSIAKPVQSQHTTDTAITVQKANAVNVYYQSLQQQSGLYNGSEYVQYTTTLKEGYPYFDTTILVRGTVFYDSLLYNDVPMLYDIIRDELIIQHFNKVFMVQLVKPKVDWFDMGGHHFLQLGRDSTIQGNVSYGFYDVLHNGKTKLYCKRIKMIQESIPDMQLERKVYEKERYFIYKDSVYHEFFSESSLLSILKDKKSELKQILRKNKIKFRKNREYAMKLMLEQYDVLNH